MRSPGADPAGFRERALARLRGEIVVTGPIHDDDTALGRKRNRNTKRNAQRQAQISPWKWKKALKHFKHTCAYCGAKDVTLEKEHFIPLALGGTLRPNNIVPSCLGCNRRKHDQHPREWLRREYGEAGETKYLEIERWLMKQPRR